MSYAEDNNLDAYDVPDFVNNEEHWKEGIHYTEQGECMKLSEMTDSHLRNCITYFKGHDTTPLEKELNKRN